MIVLDASAVVDLLLTRGSSQRIRELIEVHEALSVELLVPEVLQTLRRFEHRGELMASRADEAVEDLVSLPVDLHPVAPMARAIWEIRADITAYDAGYVALAASVGATLVTADRRLAGTAQRHCPVADLS